MTWQVQGVIYSRHPLGTQAVSARLCPTCSPEPLEAPRDTSCLKLCGGSDSSNSHGKALDLLQPSS